MAELKIRAKDLNELADSSLFLFRVRPLHLDEGARKLLDGDGRKLLGQVRAALANASNWSTDALDAAVRGVAEEAGVGLGKIEEVKRVLLAALGEAAVGRDPLDAVQI